MATAHAFTTKSLNDIFTGATSLIRVRAFIDLSVERLARSSDYVLDARELAVAESKGRKKTRRR